MLRQDYEEFIVGDYISLCSWVHILFSPREKNSVIVESTFRETKTKGLYCLNDFSLVEFLGHMCVAILMPS